MKNVIFYPDTNVLTKYPKSNLAEAFASVDAKRSVVLDPELMPRLVAELHALNEHITKTVTKISADTIKKSGELDVKELRETSDIQALSSLKNDRKFIEDEIVQAVKYLISFKTFTFRNRQNSA